MKRAMTPEAYLEVSLALDRAVVLPLRFREDDADPFSRRKLSFADECDLSSEVFASDEDVVADVEFLRHYLLRIFPAPVGLVSLI
jgi:hypothetical protein